METVKFDLMRPIGGNERFIATMRYPHCPMFKFDFNDFYHWICDKRPSVKDKPSSCHLYDKGQTVLYFNQTTQQVERQLRW